MVPAAEVVEVTAYPAKPESHLCEVCGALACFGRRAGKGVYRWRCPAHVWAGFLPGDRVVDEPRKAMPAGQGRLL